MVFGVGWSMAGLCPDPIFVNIGEGKIYATPPSPALAGAAAFGVSYERLQDLFALPSLPARNSGPERRRPHVVR